MKDPNSKAIKQAIKHADDAYVKAKIEHIEQAFNEIKGDALYLTCRAICKHPKRTKKWMREYEKKAKQKKFKEKSK